MATRSVIAKKKKTVRAVPRIKRGAKIAGPSFADWESMAPKAFHRLRRNACDFYYQNFKVADLAVTFYQWMEDNGYSKKELSAAKAGKVSATAGVYATVLAAGCPTFSESHNKYWHKLSGTQGDIKPIDDFLHSEATKAINSGNIVLQEKKKETSEVKTNTLSVQDHIFEQCVTVTADFDYWIDSFIKDPRKFKADDIDVKSHLNKHSVSQVHARKISAFYENELNEIRKVINIPTPAKLKKLNNKEREDIDLLAEGYSQYKKPDLKRLADALDSIVTECNFIIEARKAVRKPHKAKPRSANKLIEKLKFAKVDDKYKLASVSPETIIGATELWVFNTKTRKIGKYVAENIDPKGLERSGSGLSVKGTTIIGFDPEQSVQKTLRKPEEQLKDFKAAGKVKLRKFLEDIKTSSIKLNGRVNADTIILKVQ
jgi:hypothetical protein